MHAIIRVSSEKGKNIASTYPHPLPFQNPDYSHLHPPSPLTLTAHSRPPIALDTHCQSQTHSPSLPILQAKILYGMHREQRIQNQKNFIERVQVRVLSSSPFLFLFYIVLFACFCFPNKNYHSTPIHSLTHSLTHLHIYPGTHTHTHHR